MYRNKRRLLIVTVLALLLVAAIVQAQSPGTLTVQPGNTGIQTFSSPSTQNINTSGCDLANEGNVNGLWSAVMMVDFDWYPGETLIVRSREPVTGSPGMFRLDVNHVEVAAKPFPSTLSYTFDEHFKGDVRWGFDTMNEGATLIARCERSHAYVQFNHAPEVLVTPGEKPQLVVQFGNYGPETLKNLRMVCSIDGPARFTGDVWTHGAFPEVVFSPRVLRFRTLATLPPGQNYNVSFAVDPRRDRSTITCTLTNSGRFAARARQIVGIR